jgi:hypothetical protein
MDLRADFEFQEEYLLVTASGEFTVRAALSLLKQTIDTADQKGIKRVLVDCFAMQGELSTFERYDLGVEVAKYFLSKQSHAKLAIVGIAPTIDGFAVQVASNRGMSTALFATKKDALIWLESFPSRAQKLDA